MAYALNDLEEVIRQLREDVVVKTTKKAQRTALLDWRDRKDFPGVMARFTLAGSKGYGFSERHPRYGFQKGYKKGEKLQAVPDYVYTGSLRDMLKKRKPKATRVDGGVITTRFSLMGGALNLLAGQRGYASLDWVTTSRVVSIPPHTRTSKKGKLHTVSGYSVTKTRRELTGPRSSRSYAEEFGLRPADLSWIKARTETVLRELIRKVAFKKSGKRRANVWMDDERAAA